MISIQDTVNDYLRERNEEKERGNRVSMSMIGKCPRQVMLGYNNAEKKDYDDRQLRIFSVGYVFEGYLMHIIEKRGILLEKQIPCEFMGISGTADGIQKDKVLFDLKTVHSKKFQYLDDYEPDEQYAMQLTGYHCGLKEKYDLSELAKIVYVSKDDLLMKEVVFRPEDYKARLIKRIEVINESINSGIIPDEKEVPTWECFSVNKRLKKVKVWCNFINNCPNVVRAYQDAMRDISKK